MLGEPENAIELLTRDHRALERLLDQLDSENDPARLSDLFASIVRALAAHEAAEQQVVFPAFLAAVPADEQDAFRLLGEHEEINELLAEMRVLTPYDVGFEKRASALCLELRAHFEAEEEGVFPCLEASVSREDLIALGDSVIAVAQSAPIFPEPEFTEHVHAVRGPGRHPL